MTESQDQPSDYRTIKDAGLKPRSRRAELAEVQAVLAFAAQIFADEQQIPREMNVIPAEKQPQWFCMKQDGVLAGTAAVYREGGRWHMGRITVAPSLRGQHRGNLSDEKRADRGFCTGCG